MISSELRSRAFYTLAALSLLALSLAYQVKAPVQIDLGAGEDAPFLRNFYDVEQSDGLSYRWSSDRSFVYLPGIGSGTPLVLRVTLNGYRPAGLPSPLLHVKANGTELSAFTPSDQFDTYEFAVDSDAIGTPGNLEIEIDSEVFSPAQTPGEGDLRELGVLLDSISVAYQPGAAGVILPPLVHLLCLWCAVLASFVLARLCWPTRVVAFVTATLVLLVLLVLVAQQRLLAGLYSTRLVVLLVLANVVVYVFSSARRVRGLRARLLHPQTATCKQLLTLVLIFLVVFVSHSLSSVCCYAGDSVWSVPVAMSFIREHNADVDEYEQIVVSNEYYGETVVRNDNHYTIEEIRGHVYTKQPIGVSIVAVPPLLVVDNVLHYLLDADLDEYVRYGGSGQLERLVASFVVALAALFIYLIALRFLNRRYSLLVVLVFAFCTPAWSTASRALWQHGPSMLMLSAALYLILLARDRPSLVQFAGLPLALSFVIRPTNGVSVLVLTLYVAVRYRRYLLKYLLWAAVIAIPFLAFNFTIYHSLLSTYYLPQKVGSNPALLEALVANVVSPGRGLLVFSPVLLTSILGVLLRIRRREWRGLDSALLTIVILHWLAISSFGKWWAGHSYGPRFFCDVIPYLVYFTIPVFVRMSGLRGHTKVLWATLVSGLILVSFFVHYRGATSWDTHVWNEEPVGVDDEPARVWDWRDLQFLRGITIASPGPYKAQYRPAWEQQSLAEDWAMPRQASSGRPRQVESQSTCPEPGQTMAGIGGASVTSAWCALNRQARGPCCAYPVDAISCRAEATLGGSAAPAPSISQAPACRS
jgi:hypothetical protein